MNKGCCNECGYKSDYIIDNNNYADNGYKDLNQVPTDKIKMKLYDAIEIIEDIDDGVYSEDKYLEAWQLLVDTGVAWTLQGSYGRKAHELIQNGLINPAS
jgi:hypothetical protein